MARLVILIAILLALTAPAAAYSNAADFLIDEQIAAACSGGKGKITSAAVIERDLTGDGKADLIISHDGIDCADLGRSSACGIQVCSVMIYVRRGALLKLEIDDLLGMMVTVGEGEIPEIQMYGHGGTPRTLKWNGSAFR